MVAIATSCFSPQACPLFAGPGNTLPPEHEGRSVRRWEGTVATNNLVWVRSRNGNKFITGPSPSQSTAPSHSLAANYQRVIALMKYHNPIICGAAAANIAAGRGRSGRKADKRRGKGRFSPPSGTTEEEVQGLLSVLEEEFGRMTL